MMVDRNPSLSSPVAHDNEALGLRIATTLQAIRARRPRIHAITSPVAQPLTANGLLALGALPSLSVGADEIDDFIRSADGVLLNLGMLDTERHQSLPLAAASATVAKKPFVLDPVFADRSQSRRALAHALLSSAPTLVKLNASEAAAFSQHNPPGTALAVTGPVDEIRHAWRKARLANGHPLMADVTATGCLLGAILAACIAVEADPFYAGIAGVSILNIAAEIAATGAAGPGSFAIRLIDALAALDASAIRQRLKIEAFCDEKAEASA